MRVKLIAVLTVVMTMLVPARTASADSPRPHELAWELSFDEPKPAAKSAGAQQPPSVRASHARTTSSSPAQRKAAEDDLKTECARHPEAQTDQGWPHSRFDQCFLRTDAHLTLIDQVTQLALGRIDFSSSLLVLAYDGQRRIDYVFTFDDFRLDYRDFPSAAPYYESTMLTVSFSGCGTVVVCSPTPAARAELAPAWQSAPSRTFQLAVTSPNDAGDGKFKVLHSLIAMNLSAVTAFGRVQPYDQTLAYSRGRFDSALGALGGGKHWGAIMPDFVPTVVLDRRSPEYRQEAIHVDDALHNPSRTFPSFVGKSPPGEGNRPLHRLMDANLRTANNNASRSICKDVWGPDYAEGGLECDEYPFQSTYEGSAVSTNGNPSRWHGSARPIDGNHNGKGGNHLQAFYNLNRVLDENLESTRTGPTDPFNVRIVG